MTTECPFGASWPQGAYANANDEKNPDRVDGKITWFHIYIKRNLEIV
jgi:hypothetical protein